MVHVPIGSHQLTAAEFINIDSSILAFNESDDNAHLKNTVQFDEEEESVPVTEKPPNLPEVLETMRKINLFWFTQQSQSHTVISGLESQLTGIYLNSKAVNQNSINDYFDSCSFFSIIK